MNTKWEKQERVTHKNSASRLVSVQHTVQQGMICQIMVRNAALRWQSWCLRDQCDGVMWLRKS